MQTVCVLFPIKYDLSEMAKILVTLIEPFSISKHDDVFCGWSIGVSLNMYSHLGTQVLLKKAMGVGADWPMTQQLGIYTPDRETKSV